MWPLKRRERDPVTTTADPNALSFTQLDITDAFGDDVRLAPDEWIATTPLNTLVPDPVAQGLPAPDATVEDVYAAGARLSELRTSIPHLTGGDGVYCPVCHVANVELSKLGTLCPQCERPLLRFGWT